MKFLKSLFYSLAIFCALFLNQACKTKKLAAKPPVNADTVKAPVIVKQVLPTKDTPKDKDTIWKATATPNNLNEGFVFANIQFEFNSGILKTDSYPILDKAAAIIKANPTMKFILKGYASAEGSDEHNMSLSIDRANSVKTYLINFGIDVANLSAQGYGESNPVGDNSTEAGRILNRRVEIKKAD